MERERMTKRKGLFFFYFDIDSDFSDNLLESFKL